MVMKIEGQADILRAIFVLDKSEGDVREAMMTRADSLIEQTWNQTLISAAGTPAERKMLATGASADITPLGFVLNAAQGPALSGGLQEEQWPALEYGMTPVLISGRVRPRKTLGSNQSMRAASLIWVGKNLKPRNYSGYVIFPTVRKRGPEYVAAWIKGIVDLFRADPLEIEKD